MKTQNKTAPKVETAQEAIDRYKKFIGSIDKLKRSKDEFLTYYDVFFEKVKVPEKIKKTMPPSYIDFITKNGIFTIGDEKTGWSLLIKMYDPQDIQTITEILKEQLEVETAEEIADELGIEEDIIKATKNAIAYMQAGDEDYYCFDKRTKNPKTSEMTSTMCLLDDSELEYFAEEETSICDNNGFDIAISEIIDDKIKYILENEVNIKQKK